MTPKKSLLLSILTLTGIAGCTENVPDNSISWKILSPTALEGEVISANSAIDSTGNVSITWQEVELDTKTGDDGTQWQCQRTNLMTRRYSASTKNWGNSNLLHQGVWRRIATRISSGAEWKTIDSALDTETRLATDGSGNVFALWIQDTTSNCDTAATALIASVYQSTYSAAGGAWSSAELLISTPTQNAKNPSLAVSSEGTALAAWSQWDTDDNINLIYASHFDSVDTWDTPTIVSGDNGGAPLVYYSSVSPLVTINSSDDGAVFWRQINNGIHEVHARNYTATDQWSADAIKLSNASVDIRELDITSNSGGANWAVWVERGSDDTGDIVTNFLASDNSTGTAASIKGDLASTDEDESLQDAYAPQIVIDDSGNVSVAWLQPQSWSPQYNQWNNSESVAIWSNRFNGSAWGASTRVRGSDRYSIDSIALTLKANEAVVSWIQNNDARSDAAQSIYAVSYRNNLWDNAGLVSDLAENALQLQSGNHGTKLVNNWLIYETDPNSGVQQASIGVASAN